MKKIIIAIDGPSASGKSTTAKILASKLDYLHIDTGAMYRAVGLQAMRHGIELNDMNLEPLMQNVLIEQKSINGKVLTFLNGEDVSAEIRSHQVSDFASRASAFAPVRTALVDLQRQMGVLGGVILDGRDIGTVVFPNAELKIYLVASIETRAKRRVGELKRQGKEFDLELIQKDIAERDYNDSHREISPLKKADDAIEIDTSDMTIEQQVDTIYKLALSKLN